VNQILTVVASIYMNHIAGRAPVAMRKILGYKASSVQLALLVSLKVVTVVAVID